jgi:hypothetical protein
MRGNNEYGWTGIRIAIFLFVMAMVSLLAQAATISGTVFQTDGTTPITGVQIGLSFGQGNPCGGTQWVSGSLTNSDDGTYTVTGLPSGTYYVQTYNFEETNYINEWWAFPLSQNNCQNAQPLTVGAEETVTGNFQLDLGGGSISGTVYQSDGTTPITGVQIGVSVGEGNPCGGMQWATGWRTSPADGTYTVRGLSARIYYMQTYNFQGTNYTKEWWASPLSQIDCQNAQTVTMTASTAISGKNFQIDLDEPEINIKQGMTNIPSGTGSYKFGSVNVGASSSTITFTIKNTGVADLIVSSIQKLGANPGDFTVTQPISSTVTPGGSTTFTVRFTPTAAGTRTTTISIANNDSNENPYTFTVTGTGQAQASNSYLLWTK